MLDLPLLILVSLIPGVCVCVVSSFGLNKILQIILL